MSLKAFHIVFVGVCVVFALGFGGWAIAQYRKTGDASLLAGGILSIAGGLAMILYGRWFLHKLRGVSYL